MASDPQGPPPGVQFGPPQQPPPGVTFGETVQPPPGVQFGSPTPAPTQQQQPPAAPGIGGQMWQSLKEHDPTVGLISGALKEAQKHVAGAIDMADKYVVQRTTGAPTATAVVHHAANETADWLRRNTNEDTTMEKVGGFGEGAAELLAPELWGSKLLEGASYADRLLEMGKNAKILEKAPGLVPVLKAGMRALKSGVGEAVTGAAKTGALTGGQTFVESGGDPDAAVQAAETGAVMHGVTAGAFGAGGRLLDAADAARAGTRTVAGAPFETTPGTNDLMLRNLKDVAKTGEPDPATQSAQQAFGNIAKEGLANSIDRTNTLRNVTAGTEPTITTASGDAMTISKARKTLATRDSVLRNTEMSKITRNRATAARDDLANQIGNYEKWSAAQPIHPALDPVDAVDNTQNFSDAGEHLLANHGALLDRMGPEAKYDLTRLKKQEGSLQAELENPGNRSYADVTADVQGNQNAQLNLLKQQSKNLTPDEATAAISGMEDGHFFKNLHNFVQDRFNSVSAEDAARSQAKGGNLQQVFDPSQKDSDFAGDFEKFLNQKNGNGTTNRAIAQRTIGDDHITNVKDLGEMFDSAQRREQTRGLLANVGSTILRHYRGVAGYAIGLGAPLDLALAATRHVGMAAELTAAGIPIPVATGAVAGVRNHLQEQLATNPKFLKSFTFALKNNIPARTAGPLIAARALAHAAAPDTDKPQEQK